MVDIKQTSSAWLWQQTAETHSKTILLLVVFISRLIFSLRSPDSGTTCSRSKCDCIVPLCVCMCVRGYEDDRVVAGGIERQITVNKEYDVGLWLNRTDKAGCPGDCCAALLLPMPHFAPDNRIFPFVTTSCIQPPECPCVQNPLLVLPFWKLIDGRDFSSPQNTLACICRSSFPPSRGPHLVCTMQRVWTRSPTKCSMRKDQFFMNESQVF